MKITYLDADTREVIEFVDDPSPAIHELELRQQAVAFAAGLNAKIVKLTPHDKNEWTIELKIPLEVRRAHTPLPGDRVRFRANVGVHEHELIGVYHFRLHHSYVIFDDGGGEWELQSMWQMKKV